jgi:hypothetical protein
MRALEGLSLSETEWVRSVAAKAVSDARASGTDPEAKAYAAVINFLAWREWTLHSRRVVLDLLTLIAASGTFFLWNHLQDVFGPS